MIILNFSSKGGMPQPVGVQSRDQTVIIVPNSGKLYLFISLFNLRLRNNLCMKLPRELLFYQVINTHVPVGTWLVRLELALSNSRGEVFKIFDRLD